MSASQPPPLTNAGVPAVWMQHWSTLHQFGLHCWSCLQGLLLGNALLLPESCLQLQLPLVCLNSQRAWSAEFGEKVSFSLLWHYAELWHHVYNCYIFGGHFRKLLENDWCSPFLPFLANGYEDWNLPTFRKTWTLKTGEVSSKAAEGLVSCAW